MKGATCTMSSPKPIIAEVMFPASMTRCLGKIVALSADSISVSISDAERVLRSTVKSEEGEISFSLNGVLHVAYVQFSTLEAGTGTLHCALSHLEYGIQQRRARRVSVAVRAAWRVAHGGNIFSAWSEGITQDISTAGMRLVVPAMLENPHQIEVLLYLNIEISAVQDESALEPTRRRSSTLDYQEIRLRGSVKHMAQLPFGKAALGISFTRISDLDKLRLLRFLADRVEEIQGVRKSA